MSKLLVYDYEVFRYDTLLGCTIIDEQNKETVFQTWDPEEIKKFYNEHVGDLWIGHNNFKYDDFMTEAVVKNQNVYEVSQKIIKKEFYNNLNLKLLSFDLIKLHKEPYSLKLTELICGKNIHESEIDFNMNRKLTEEEKRLVEQYNRDDLDQTVYNTRKMFDSIKLRLDIIKEFNLNLEHSLRLPGYMLAASVLGAKGNPALKYKKISPSIPSSLKIKNQKVLDYFLNGTHDEKEDLKIVVGGTEVNFGGNGGAHGARKKVLVDKVKYIDVSGYYNLIAIVYNLLPRSLSEEGKQKYIKMYYEQLEMKKVNPIKREQYKTILLSVIGSMNMQDSPFYDPEAYKMLTTLGRVFIYDLLEKLDPLINLIQVNTDGLILEPKDWKLEKEIDAIINEWVNRTKFTVKNDHLYRFWQRDVNAYCCVDEKNQLIYKGKLFKNYDIGDKAYASFQLLNCEEPPIIAQGIIKCLMYDKMPREFVYENKKNLKLFQYACKTGKGADFITYDTVNLETFERETYKLQGVDRAFALKSNKISGMVYKHKDRYGKQSISKYPGLPENVFIYNNSIEGAYEKIGDQIDYEYYIKRIEEKIQDFI